MAGAAPIVMAVGSEQPGIQQAPHTHEGLLLHPALNAPVPVGAENIYINKLTAVLKGFTGPQ